MYKNEVQEILKGNVIRVNISDIEKFMMELKSTWKFQAEILTPDNIIVEILNDDYLLGIPVLIFKNQEELESASHLPCCGQLVENCNCNR